MRKERFCCLFDLDIFLIGFYCKDGVLFLNKLIVIDIYRFEEKMYIKLSVIICYEEWVVNFVELRCIINNNNNK